MNIGIFTNAYHPLVSGVVQAIDVMRDGLGDLGHRVYVVAPRYAGYEDDDDYVFRYPSIQILSDVDFPLPIPYDPRLTAAIQKLPLDVVHVQHPFLLGTLGAKLAAKKNLPLVFTFHTRYEDYAHYAPFGIPPQAARVYVRQRVSSFLKKCSAIVAPAPSIREVVEEYGGGDRCHLISNAIQLGHFKKADGHSVRAQYKLDGKKIAVFVGRLAQEKNLLMLLQSFAKARTKFKDCGLMLVGDGPFRPILEKEAARLHISPHVIFTGMVPYEHIPRYLGASQLFVITSTSEVKPLSILEAMASGLPVLAVRAPGAKDTVTHQVDGWLSGEDPSDFSDALVSLLKSEERLNKLGAAAKKKAEEFGQAHMAKKLEKLYKDLLKKLRDERAGG